MGEVLPYALTQTFCFKCLQFVAMRQPISLVLYYRDDRPLLFGVVLAPSF